MFTEEDWSKKYSILKEQVEVLKKENNEITTEIERLNGEIDSRKAIKANYKALEAEKKISYQPRYHSAERA